MIKTRRARFLFYCLAMCVSLIALPFSVSAKTVQKVKKEKPDPPPVTIEMTADKASAFVGDIIEIRIQVTPSEAMHVDIQCLLPEAVKPVRENGVKIRPGKEQQRPRGKSLQKGHGRTPAPIYKEAVKLWVGPLPAGEAREFAFQVHAERKGAYKLIAIVDALAKWGTKEKDLVINVR